MTIEHILGRHPIEFTEQEAIDILAAATGLPCADTYADGIGFEDPGDAATEAGVVFAQQFAGRRFSSLTDALLSVIDIQSEMLQAAGSRDSRGGVLQSIADQLGLGALPSLHSAYAESVDRALTYSGIAPSGSPSSDIYALAAQRDELVSIFREILDGNKSAQKCRALARDALKYIRECEILHSPAQDREP